MAGSMREDLKVGTLLRENLSFMDRTPQASSSYDYGTSSDSDEEDIKQGLVAKALQRRAKILYLTSLKHLCMTTIIANKATLEASKEQRKIFAKMG
jgi:arginyl-tRNA--protein-N-Asp/Glu arginylyltransferase